MAVETLAQDVDGEGFLFVCEIVAFVSEFVVEHTTPLFRVFSLGLADHAAMPETHPEEEFRVEKVHAMTDFADGDVGSQDTCHYIKNGQNC